MKIESLAIPDVKLITPSRIRDDRGFFEESFNKQAFAKAGVHCDFIQDNHSYSAKKWTMRGLHFQAPPYAQNKLVRVLCGAVLDVAVDARPSSPSFGHWVKAVLSAENGAQMLSPIGFLHGFLTLEPDTHVAYKVDAYYDRGCDGAIKWNDPDLAVEWGDDIGDVSISAKDDAAQSWAAFKSPF